jgi:hypothetical protein
MATTTLVKRFGLSHTLSMVQGETTIPAYLLQESEEFLDLLRTAVELDELTDWANDNF